MIADLIRITGLYVMLRVFLYFALPRSKLLIKYFYWTTVILMALSVVGPRLTQVADDFHDLTTTYKSTRDAIVGATNEVSSLSEKIGSLPLLGNKATFLPPAKTIGERLNIFGINKKFFEWPVKGEITQGFSDKHHGIDIAAKEGTVIAAAREGKIVKVDSNDVYGNYIILDHDGQWQTLYAHLNQVLAKEGQRVFGGGQIGTVGSTGNSTGPHLHFEIRVGGKAIDPAEWMK